MTGHSPVRPVQRVVWAPVETAPVPAGRARLDGRSIAVIGGGERSSAALAAALRAAGATAHRFAPPDGDLTASEVIEAANRFLAVAGRLDGIVDLNLEESIEVTGSAAWAPALRQTFALLQACYPEWVAESAADRLFYLATTRLGGQMGFSGGPLSQPLGGIWAGLAKGLPREIPNCNVRIVDLAPEHCADAAELVVGELYRWGLFEVGYRGGRRYTLVPRREPVGPPALTLGPDDTVVMSGGGRGIGFDLARTLAADLGCRVVVSGRAAAPDGGDPLMTMPDGEFRRYRDERLRSAVTDRRLPAERERLRALERARELWAHLCGARRDGLRIEYHRCDIRDPEQTARLIERAGTGLVGVVHNAGTDSPIRLPAKSLDAVTEVIGVKVDGFLNLVRAVADRPGIRFFCSVGSLTGRLGGMTGELDYGAANEGLSRLGLWAAARPAAQPGRPGRLPVRTVCWPTWERLGMISNFAATLRYMSAMDVADARRRWVREILTGGDGEVTFLGEIGPDMQPSILRGYPAAPALPGVERLVSSRYFLGEPVDFRPGRQIRVTHSLDATTLPCCDDFRLAGEPALPVSLCLAYLLACGEWVLPGQPAGLRLAAVRDVSVELTELAAGPGRQDIRLVGAAVGRRDGDAWSVRATLHRQDAQVARAELVYRPDPDLPDVGVRPDLPDVGVRPDLRDVGVRPDLPEVGPGLGGSTRPESGLHWYGQAFPLVRWQHRSAGGWWAPGPSERVADLLTVTPTPRPPLGLAEAENLIRGGYLCQLAAGGPVHPARVRVDLLHLGGADGTGWLSGDAGQQTWTAHDPAGRPRLRLSGLRFHDRAG